jgi:hypothetical protein
MRATDPVSLGKPKVLWIIERKDSLDFWGTATKTSVCTTRAGFERSLAKYADDIKHVTEVTCYYKELDHDGN